MKTRVTIYILALFLLGCGKKEPTESFLGRSRQKVKKEVEVEAISTELQNAVRITTGDYYDCFPSWSPDGKKIAYASCRNGVQNIWVVEISISEGKPVPGSKLTNLTTGDFIDETPSWSPDGERIVFSSNRNGKPGLFIVELSGKKIIDLEQEGTHPQWSPQNSEIAFVDMNNIWIKELDGKKKRRYLTASGYNEFPCWTGDDKKIIFSSGGNLMSINKNGSMRVPLTSFGWNNQPEWCNGRKRIVFVSNRGKYYDLWEMKQDGAEPTQLTDGQGHESSPTCSPDDNWIAFHSNYSGSSDIWAIPAKSE